MISLENKKVFSNLYYEIIEKKICVACGACVAVCPIKVIDFKNNLPVLIGNCIQCGLCYENCPVTGFNESKMEEKLFGRNRNEKEKNYGVSIGLYAVKAISKNIISKCQDGGAATALLIQALKQGLTGALVVDKNENGSWMPKPVIASDEDTIIKSAGTKYTSAPIIKKMVDLVDNKQNNLALIGTPCQIKAIRKIENGNLSKSKIGQLVKLKLGLFCMETFDYDSLMEFLKNENIDVNKIKKFEIKKGKFIIKSENNQIQEIKLSKMKQLVRQCCKNCNDFASEFADVSIGNVGSPEGYSTVITRTLEGEQILKNAERQGLIEIKSLYDYSPGIVFVDRLASEKKKRVPLN